MILALATLAIGARAVASPEAFDEANRAYAEGHYEQARDTYMSLVKSGEYSTNLFYNLGNTWAKLEQPGRAMLNYERALALNPGHPEAAADLSLLRERNGAAIAPAGWTRRIYPDIRLDTFAAVAAGALWLFAFAIAALWLGAGRRKPWIAVAGIALALAAYAAPACHLSRLNDHRAIIISAKSVARFAPVLTSGGAATLPAGSHVRVLAPRGDWVYGELPDAQRVWIPASDLESVRLSRS